MQRYKALLEKTITVFWNRWITTNRRVEMNVMYADREEVCVLRWLHKGHGRVRSGPPITQVIPGQSTGYRRASWHWDLPNREGVSRLKPLKPQKRPFHTT